MNCRYFQNRLYEYVEGTLSAEALAAADKHLALCSACRQAVRKEQQLAQFLSDRLHHDTETLALRSSDRLRILAAVENKSTSPANEMPILGLWNRLVWPLVMAVALLLIVAFLRINYFSSAHKTTTAQSSDRDTHSAVSIQFSYCEPTYKFHQEGDFVVDTLSCETIVASETLQTGDHKSLHQKSEKEMSL
jgi:anti-sigma-K factor RskA